MREALAYIGLLVGALLACSYPEPADHRLDTQGWLGGGAATAWQTDAVGGGGAGGGIKLGFPDAGGSGGASGDAGDDGDAGDAPVD
jgi:hypothetical protein